MADSKVYRSGHYETLYNAVANWVTTEFPFSRPYYSNVEIPAKS
ncbi:hypothetical protein SAMN06265355_101388 [Actinomadura mexicana]|uniref:Uncharacterized protein n=1 Tax=Actinomadura mexicana TaxID=134959 RepID=A0A238UTN8_9ACTN|nr:hypothetical protein SAMN06265355_101388 [Actinomadura mexicana]